MTEQEKELLIKVLCELLPHGVKVNISASKDYDNYIPSINDATITALDIHNERCNFKEFYWDKEVVNVRPYLRPMSSMTEEEHNDWFQYYQNAEMEELNKSGDYFKAAISGDNAKYDWLNANCFDYRGLIPMGLALPATEDMYK